MVAVAGVLLAPATVALAQGAAGAGFAYNPGTHSVSLHVKNNSSSAGLTKVEFTLPGGTVLVGQPTGGGTCTATTPQAGSCTYFPAKPPGGEAFLLINTSGSRPGSVDVTATFDDGSSVSLTAVECGTISVAPDTLATGTVGSPYSQQLSASGGTAPYTFGFQGGPPPGVSFSPSGLLSGTPTQGGTYGLQVLPSDANGCPGERSYSITIQDAGGTAQKKPDVAITLSSISPVTSNGQFAPFEEASHIDSLFRGEVAGAHHYFGRVKGRLAVTNTGEVTTDAQVHGDLIQDERVLQASQDDPRGGDCEVHDIRFFGSRRLFDFLCANLAPGETREMPFVYSIADFSRFPADPPHAGTLQFTAEVRPVDGTPDDNFIPHAGAAAVDVKVVNGPVSDQDAIPRKVSAGKLGGFSGHAGTAASKASRSMLARTSATGSLEKIKKVEIALVALQGGARAARAGCLWLRDARAHFKRTQPRTKRCDVPIWLRASGTSRWRFRLRKRLPKGSYALYSRAADAAGLSQEVFGRTLGNRQTFKVT